VAIRLAGFLLALLLALPSWCAGTYITGFEMGSLGEVFTSSGTVSVQSAIKRTGNYSLRINPTAAAGRAVLQATPAGGGARSLFGSFRLYVRFAAVPTTNDYSMTAYLQMNAGGFLRVSGSGTDWSSYSASALSLDTWYRISVDRGWNGGLGAKVYVDGVEYASVSTGSAGAISNVVFGEPGNRTVDWYIDDFLSDDGSAVIGAGQAILLPPISDNTDGTWLAGAGGASLFTAVDSIPPIGTATETDSTQIENATNSANQDALLNCRTYTDGGIGASDTINAVMAIGNDGEDVGTGTKTGEYFISSNPAQGVSGFTFDFGDDVGALGTFPSNWSTHVSPVVASPSVTKDNSPVVGIRAVSATTRVRSADFLGVYVDYTPAAGGTVVKDIIMRGVIVSPR